MRRRKPAPRARIVSGSLGHLTAIIEMTPDHMTQSHRVEFSIDQTDISRALSACRRDRRAFSND
jgi:hypothetical protein